MSSNFEIENENKNMRKLRIDQPYRDSSVSRSIYKSLTDLSSINQNGDAIARIRQGVVNKCNMNPSMWQQCEWLENTFEGDSSTSFWHRNMFNANRYDDDFNANVIFTTDKFNASHFHSDRFNNTQNAFDASPPLPLPHRSVSGFPGNQSEGFESKDSNGKEKRKLTRQYFVTVFSICYAMFLVVFGAIIFIGDAVHSQYPLPQAFCIYMLLMSIMYILYLFIDIRLQVYRAKKQLKVRTDRKHLIDEYMKNLNNGCINLKVPAINDAAYALAIRELNLSPLEAISHRYCFVSGRNGSSLYEKLGASCFAFGLLVYAGLQISYDVFFISLNGSYLYECASYITLILNILFALYSMLTLLFIIKYMNVVINVNQNLARMFLLHAIGTSLSLWVFTIIRETADAIAESDAENHAKHLAMHRSVAKSNETFEFVYDDCGKSNALNAIHRQFEPYLYPFVIEYCILVVGIWCKIYENINHCPRNKSNPTTGDIDDESSEYSSTYLPKQFDNISEHDKAIQTSFHIYANCQSSFSGIFLGFLLVILTITFIILMFAGFQNRSYLKTSILINDVFKCSVLLILIVCTICAYSKTIKLDISLSPALEIDDIILLAAIPAFIIECIFKLKPALTDGSFLEICIPICRLIEVIIQTPFIIDGRRRSSNTQSLQEAKPGRGLVIFLCIVNVSLWIHDTFSGKAVYAIDKRYTYYGYRLWNILNHICQPLIMFYRFHSSVCLVSIWNHAYQPDEKLK